MRSAIVHDWLISAVGGAEKVLEAIYRLFPSKIHTLVQSKKGLKNTFFENLEIEHLRALASFLHSEDFQKAEKE